MPTIDSDTISGTPVTGEPNRKRPNTSTLMRIMMAKIHSEPATPSAVVSMPKADIRLPAESPCSTAPTTPSSSGG